MGRDAGTFGWKLGRLRRLGVQAGGLRCPGQAGSLRYLKKGVPAWVQARQYVYVFPLAGRIEVILVVRRRKPGAPAPLPLAGVGTKA